MILGVRNREHRTATRVARADTGAISNVVKGLWSYFSIMDCAIRLEEVAKIAIVPEMRRT